MRKLRPRRERTFSPLRDKVLTSMLRQLFVARFGYEKKIAFAEAMISEILNTIDAFVKPLSAVKPGQLVWMAVVHDGGKHTFQDMRDTPQVPVVLDLITDGDLRALAEGDGVLNVQRRRHARLLDQAMEQGGVLAFSDLTVMTLAGEDQIRRDVAHVKEAEGRILPHRGSVQDIGPTLSHKVEVARLLEAGYLEPEICHKLSPVHDLRSVERYAQTYKNVLKLLDGGFAPSDIAGILALSNRLVETYVELVREHHPDIVARNGSLQSPEPEQEPSLT